MSHTDTFRSREGAAGDVPFDGLVTPAVPVGKAVIDAAAAVADAVARVYREARRRRQIKQTEAVLRGLSDATLYDIGVSRSEIREAARAAADEETYRA